MTEPVLGVDLGGTYLRVAAADGGGQVYAERTERVGALTADGFAQRIDRLVSDLCPDGVSAVAIGVPAPVGADGSIGPLINLPDLNDVPLGTLVRDGWPSRSWSRTMLTSRRSVSSGGAVPRAGGVVFIAVGTGVGMGIVIGGRISVAPTAAPGSLARCRWTRPGGEPGRTRLARSRLSPAGAGLARQWAALTGAPPDGRDVYTAAERGDARPPPSSTTRPGSWLWASAPSRRCLTRPVLFGGGIGARPEFTHASRRRWPPRHPPPEWRSARSANEPACSGRSKGARCSRGPRDGGGRRLMFLDVLLRRNRTSSTPRWSCTDRGPARQHLRPRPRGRPPQRCAAAG